MAEFEQVVGHDEEFKPKRTILLPIDHSKATLNTVHYVIENILNPLTDLIILVNVRPFLQSELNSLTPYAPFHPAERISEHERILKANAHKLLTEVAKHFQNVDGHVKAVAMRGDPRDALELKIEMVKPTMVLLGNRGSS
jgi:nucleotide-binding universal stress UspA family protein